MLRRIRVRAYITWKLVLRDGDLPIRIGLALVLATATTVLTGSVGGFLAVPLACAAVTIWWRPRRLRPTSKTLQHAMEGIETERLALRRPCPEDVSAFAATIDAEVIEANGWAETTVQDMLRLLGRRLPWPGQARILVTDRLTGEIIGSISSEPVIAGTPACHLGWWMRSAERGRGYGTEALRAVFPAIHGAGVPEIIVGTMPGNSAVRRVLEKLGATERATLPHKLPNGATVPSVWYVHTDSRTWPEGAVAR